MTSEIAATLDGWLSGDRSSPVNVGELFDMFERANGEAFYYMGGGGGGKGGGGWRGITSTTCCATGTCD